jgi:hypothetical protein
MADKDVANISPSKSTREIAKVNSSKGIRDTSKAHSLKSRSSRDKRLHFHPDMRQKVFEGYIPHHDVVHLLEPKFDLFVFISSTLSDTKIEREILMYEILPQLRGRTRLQGINVTFVDLGWGIPGDELAKEQRTWEECSRELERCRQLSSSLFFLSLQSEK